MVGGAAVTQEWADRIGADGYAEEVTEAVAKAKEYTLCGMVWVVDCDIKDFFDSIPHKLLLKALKSKIGDRKVLTLIERWIESGTV